MLIWDMPLLVRQFVAEEQSAILYSNKLSRTLLIPIFIKKLRSFLSIQFLLVPVTSSTF